jgi:hypothetical protein
MNGMDGYRLGTDEARILVRDRVRELHREAGIARAGRLGRGPERVTTNAPGDRRADTTWAKSSVGQGS